MSKLKITNWSDYNKNLVKRGKILFSFAENSYEKFYYSEPQKQGGLRQYSDYMYEYLLTLKIILRLPWRAAIGFAQSLLNQAFPGQNLAIPDYAHACRAVAKLKLKIRQYLPSDPDGIEIALDATGVKVYSASEHHQRKSRKSAAISQSSGLLAEPGEP